MSLIAAPRSDDFLHAHPVRGAVGGGNLAEAVAIRGVAHGSPRYAPRMDDAFRSALLINYRQNKTVGRVAGPHQAAAQRAGVHAAAEAAALAGLLVGAGAGADDGLGLAVVTVGGVGLAGGGSGPAAHGVAPAP